MNTNTEILAVESMAAQIRGLEEWAAGELLELAKTEGLSAQTHQDRLHYIEYVISTVAALVKSNAEKMAELSVNVLLLSADEAVVLENYRNASKANQKILRQLALRQRNASLGHPAKAKQCWKGL